MISSGKKLPSTTLTQSRTTNKTSWHFPVRLYEERQQMKRLIRAIFLIVRLNQGIQIIAVQQHTFGNDG